jgi:hypothetical protein
LLIRSQMSVGTKLLRGVVSPTPAS